ncbi:signal recognition particle, SRP9/SRP14 subunit [Tuber magnatum]|uniref:Signal recognition particle subunit SRP14 n=1 Tax=Tuber magnatum TaxID=42249 RepID=A0A317SUH1_9PEZI|nr:signal recognition particle, SRP9/SRP14 subunit [Tuber magnatum]
MAEPPRLTHEEFFKSLTTLLTTATAKEKSTVYLTQKPLLHISAPTASTAENPPLLIRATNGDSKDQRKKGDKRDGRIKISTVVMPNELQSFFEKYAEVAKGGMGSLKRRDRKARKKAKKKGKEGV